VLLPSFEDAGWRDCLRRQLKETQSAEADERCGLKYAPTIAAQSGFTKDPVIGTSATIAATMTVTSTLCALRRCWRRNRLGGHESFTDHAHSGRDSIADFVANLALPWTIAARAVTILANSGYEPTPSLTSTA
jgi:hypothetical protein